MSAAHLKNGMTKMPSYLAPNWKLRIYWRTVPTKFREEIFYSMDDTCFSDVGCLMETLGREYKPEEWY